MSAKSELLSRFEGSGEERPLYLPDLTSWYAWHRERGSLPERRQGLSLPQVAWDLRVPAWVAVCPWRAESAGVEVETTEGIGERVVRTETPVGGLTSRWTLGPDGAWWQTEYPVKTAEDLKAAMAIVRSRVYVLSPEELLRQQAEVGDRGIVAIQIPSRPFAELMQDFLGWSEGLMLLMDRPPEVQEILGLLEDRLRGLVQEVALMPGCIVLSPDNLDGQFIPPRVFQEHLAGSYRGTVEILSRQGKRLVVHAGGPVGRLLAPLAEAGVDGVQGVGGLLHGDLSLGQARESAGSSLTLWGGIPQELLLSRQPKEAFEAGVEKAAREAAGDSRMILGVADRVPVEAELDRLEALPALVNQAT